MRQIALDAGVTHTVLSKLVAGTTWPDLRTLLALSDTLGVDLIAGATQAQDRSHHETLLRDFCATLGQWSVSRVMVLGYECAILANPAPVLIALPNAGASLSSLHRAMGAVISCAHKADVPGRLLVLETKPPTDVLKLLKTSAISAQWRSAAGGFDGALGRALNPQLLAADT